MTGSKAWPESRLCSVVSKAAREDPAGCGTPFLGYLGIEIAPPWKPNVIESPRFPQPLREAVERAQDAGVIGKFTALFPDPVYSREGYVRTLDRKSTRLNSSHANISYAVFCLKKK